MSLHPTFGMAVVSSPNIFLLSFIGYIVLQPSLPGSRASGSTVAASCSSMTAIKKRRTNT